jgi:hypothetical protein
VTSSSVDRAVLLVAHTGRKEARLVAAEAAELFAQQGIEVRVLADESAELLGTSNAPVTHVEAGPDAAQVRADHRLARITLRTEKVCSDTRARGTKPNLVRIGNTQVRGTVKRRVEKIRIAVIAPPIAVSPPPRPCPGRVAPQQPARCGLLPIGQYGAGKTGAECGLESSDQRRLEHLAGVLVLARVVLQEVPDRADLERVAQARGELRPYAGERGDGVVASRRPTR